MTTHPTRYFVLGAIVLGALNLGFSLHARVSPQDICIYLQRSGLVQKCQPGTPWAFEVVRHEAQWTFEPTGSEIFKCYTVTDGFTHVPCTFKGVITQFEHAGDLEAGIAHIRAQNHHVHNAEDLKANVTRADTTLEHYILHKIPRLRTLVILPVTEDSAQLQQRLNTFGENEVVL